MKKSYIVDLLRGVVILVVLAFGASCGDDDPVVPDPGEARLFEVEVLGVLGHDVVFGDSRFMLRYYMPAGVNYFREATYRLSSDSLYFRVIIADESENVVNPPTNGHPDSAFVEVDFDIFSDPGTYYAVAGGKTIPISGYGFEVLPPSTISNIVFDPPPPATLSWGETVNIDFDYTTPVDGTICFRMVTKFYGGATCGCPGFPSGSGSGHQCFTYYAHEDPIHIEEVSFGMVSSDNDERSILEVTVPAEYTFWDF